MNKVLLLILFVACHCIHASAQTPTYKYSAYDTGGQVGSIVYTKSTQLKWLRMKAYYSPSDFPGMPSGAITAFYVRSGTIPGSVDTANFHYTSLGIGSTEDTAFTIDTKGYGVFSNDVHDFVDYSHITDTGMQTIGAWRPRFMGLPRIFYYDNTKNYAIDFQWHASSDFSLMTSLSPNRRMLVQYPDSLHPVFVPALLDIGFDVEVEPTSVSSPRYIKSFGLFPNPTTNGRFNVSLTLTRTDESVHINVADAMGRLAYSNTFKTMSNRVLQEVNLNNVSKGIYFLKVTADGETVMRRVVLE